MSLFEVVEGAKEVVCLRGGGGVQWSVVAEEMGVKRDSVIENYVLKKLKKCRYVITDTSSSSSSSSSTVSDYWITAPAEDRYRALDIPPPDPFLNILEKFAAAKQHGLTVVEAASRLNTNTNTLHPSLEKLVTLQLLTKCSIIPKRNAENPRNGHRIYVYHLKRFLKFYEPEADGMMWTLDENSSKKMEEVIIGTLNQYGVTKLSLKKLRIKMGIDIPHQAFRKDMQSMINILKDNSKLVLFTGFDYSRQRNIKETAPCQLSIGFKSVYSKETLNEDDSAQHQNSKSLHCQTVRNLALYEQLADRLNVAPCGLPSNQISQILGVPKRKVARMIKLLVDEKKETNYNYSSKRIRAGKVSANVLLGKDLRVKATEDELAYSFGHQQVENLITIEDNECDSLADPSKPSSLQEMDIDKNARICRDKVESLNGIRNKLFASEENRRIRLIQYVDKLGGICEHYSFCWDDDRSQGEKLSKVDKRTVLRTMERIAEEDDSYICRDVELKPYRIGMKTQARFLLCRGVIQEQQAHYPANTADDTVINDMITNYMERLFVPWRRKLGDRSSFLDFVNHNDHHNRVQSVKTSSEIGDNGSGMRYDDDRLALNAKDKEKQKTTGEEVWLCDRNFKGDLVDKLISHMYYFDTLKFLLCIPPTYPASNSDYNLFNKPVLDLNDIQESFMRVVKLGIVTDNPRRVLTFSDFLESARFLHMELFKQAVILKQRLRSANCDDDKEDTTFDVDIALTRLPIRFLIRNYGLHESFRQHLTKQFLDKGFLLQEEICYEHRVLVHAVKSSRASMDSLLKNSNYTVQEIGQRLIAHAKVQVTREFAFLEGIDCIKRSCDAGCHMVYSFCFRPDVSSGRASLKRLKDINNLWERDILPFIVSDSLDCSTGQVDNSFMLQKVSVQPSPQSTTMPLESVSPATHSNGKQLAQKRKRTEETCTQLKSIRQMESAKTERKYQSRKKRKYISENVVESESRMTSTNIPGGSSGAYSWGNNSLDDDFIADDGENEISLPHEAVVICRCLWKLFLPGGMPDVLKCDEATISENDHHLIFENQLRLPHHPAYWYHPQHQYLPNHSFTPSKSNIGTPNSLVAGEILNQKSFAKDIANKSIDLKEITTLHEMVTLLVACGDEALQFLCDNFESVYVEEELSGEGSDVLIILNDLLTEATKNAGQKIPDQVYSSPLNPCHASMISINSLHVACMTRVLQVYMTHPSIYCLFNDRKDVVVDVENDNSSMTVFYENLVLLREYPVEVVIAVHRELYIKKLLKRRKSRAGILNMDDAYVLDAGFELGPNFASFFTGDPSVSMFFSPSQFGKRQREQLLTRIGRLQLISKNGAAKVNMVTQATNRPYFVWDDREFNSRELLHFCQMVNSKLLSPPKKNMQRSDNLQVGGVCFKQLNSSGRLIISRHSAEKKARSSQGAQNQSNAVTSGDDTCEKTSEGAESHSKCITESSHVAQHDIYPFDLSGSKVLTAFNSINGVDLEEETDGAVQVKRIGDIHHFYGSDVFNRVQMEISATSSNTSKFCTGSVNTNHVKESCIPTMPLKSSESENKMDYFNPAVTKCLLRACESQSGAYFLDIVSFFLQESSRQEYDSQKLKQSFPYDIHQSDNRQRLERDIGLALDLLTRTASDTLENTLLLYELPIFSNCYEQRVDLRHFVLPESLSLHTVDPSTLEGCCPWMKLPSQTKGPSADDVGRNEGVYKALIAKILTVLIRQPHTTASSLHAELRAMLNVTQMCILLQTMIDDDLVICSDEEHDSTKVGDIFFDESCFLEDENNAEPKNNGELNNATNVESECVSFRHKFFSLNKVL